MNRYVNAMRSLALQCIKKAGSGHAGMAISAAPILYTLYKGLMTISKSHPKWFNRDRLVLSAGHGSMSLYPIFHFASLISMEDMKQFRNDNHITPGHPEVLSDNYVDASTGPLGQGVANAVGMAMSELYLRNEFAALKGVVNHYTYCVVGDGDLQEGISYEAMSIAGRLGLSKLIMIHDSNNFQLDSAVADVSNENLKQRVESMGWNYLSSSNSPEDIFVAIAQAKQKKNTKPTFIEVKTIIAEGTSVQDSHKAHAPSVNDDEIANFEKHFKTNARNFEFHPEIYDHFHFNVVARGESAYAQWEQLVEQYKKTNPKETKRFLDYINGDFEDLNLLLDESLVTNTSQSTRNYIKEYFLQLTKQNLKSAFVLSADLAKSTYTQIGNDSFNDNYAANYVKFGIREFAMAGALNGIMLHSGLKAFGGTFLAFADYMKPAIRLAAISNISPIFIFSHDSYAVGADGPTHQPVDQIPMLRSIPNIDVFRVADHYETKYALDYAYKNKTNPVVIITTRQNVLQINNVKPQDFSKGAYIVNSKYSFADNPDFTIIATGSEVATANQAAQLLFEKYQLKAKVISALNLNQFLKQDEEFIKSILKSKYGVLSVEASSESLWWKLTKYTSHFNSIQASQFGRSADGLKLMDEFGFNPQNIVDKLLEFKNK